MKSGKIVATAMFTSLILTALGVAQDSPNAKVQLRVAGLKKMMAEDNARLKQYEWIETTVVSLKGEEKSHKQNRCYYGAEGTVQKVPIDPTAAPEQARGLRGRIKEKKKEEMTEYMKQAVEMVKLYVPPNPDRIHAAVEAGKVSIVPEPSQDRVRLDISDYEKPGDKLSLELDLKTSRITSIQVKTYLDDAADAVGLKVRFGNLEDGTGYPEDIVLDAQKKEIKVEKTNSGYRKMSSAPGR